MGLANGQVVDSFEGLPQRQQLQQFFQVLMDEANKALGPVGVASKHYEEMLTVRALSYHHCNVSVDVDVSVSVSLPRMDRAAYPACVCELPLCCE